jgi:hypothetical protein
VPQRVLCGCVCYSAHSNIWYVYYTAIAEQCLSFVCINQQTAELATPMTVVGVCRGSLRYHVTDSCMYLNAAVFHVLCSLHWHSQHYQPSLPTLSLGVL